MIIRDSSTISKLQVYTYVSADSPMETPFSALMTPRVTSKGDCGPLAKAVNQHPDHGTALQAMVPKLHTSFPLAYVVLRSRFKS